MKRALRLVIPLAALLLSGGCGGTAPAPGPATVRGKVTLNGQPVASGLVVFTPHPERGGRGKSAYAETGPDGSYSLQLDKANAIPPGWYRVSLSPAPAPSGFPAKLARPDASGIEREVHAGKEHVFEFVVEVKE